jgi:hypothetical protein
VHVNVILVLAVIHTRQQGPYSMGQIVGRRVGAVAGLNTNADLLRMTESWNLEKKERRRH